MNCPFSSEKNVPRLLSSPVVVLLLPYHTSNLAPWMGLPVTLSTLLTVKVGFLWFSKYTVWVRLAYKVTSWGSASMR